MSTSTPTSPASVDALKNSLQTGVYSAESARVPVTVTKSGSNALHGTVFEFHRDDALDARPYAFTAAQAVAPKAPFKWDQFGYTAGGPVWKNHLFFMSNWEGYNDNKQFQTLYSVPSAAMRKGDFSELLSSLGAVNPQTGQRAGIVVDPNQCTVVGTTRTPALPATSSANRLNAISSSCSGSAEPNNGTGLNNNIVAAGSRHR
jgi:hypothetical protein